MLNTSRVLWLCALAGLVASAPAVAGIHVSHIGSIEEGLAAPMSIAVSVDEIAVLEPFADRILVYRADGQLARSMDITGEGTGLVRLPGTRYAFCDREAAAVLAVDLMGATDPVALTPPEALRDPMDALVAGEVIWVLDAELSEVVSVGFQGGVTSRRALVTQDGTPLLYPTSMALSGGELFVFEQSSSRVHVYAEDGGYLRSFCSFGSEEGTVSRGGCLRAGAGGLVYVADRFQGRVEVFEADGSYAGRIDPLDLGERRLDLPVGLALDGSGLLYVASAEAGRIDVFNAERDAGGALPVVTAVGPRGHDIPAEGLRLSIEAVSPTGYGEGIAVDFRLWTADEPTVPLEVGGSVAPVIVSGTGGMYLLEASWSPETPLQAGTSYRWSARLRDVVQAGTWSPVWEFTTAVAARVFKLEQNWPNPFRPATRVAFHLPEAGDARLSIYDLLGREIWTRELTGLGQGRHETMWPGVDKSGRSAAPGVYFYRLTAGGRTATRKMVLAR